MSALASWLSQAALFLGAVLLARLLLAYRRFRRLELAIPGPASLPVLGNALSLAGIRQADVLPTLLAFWGGRLSLSRFSIFNMLFVFVTHPDDLNEVLYKRRDLQDKPTILYNTLRDFMPKGLIPLNGEDWKLHRRVMQPMFGRAALTRFVEVFEAAARELAAAIVPGAELEVWDDLQVMGARILVRTGGLGDSGAYEREVEKYLKFLDLLMEVMNWRLWRPWVWPAAVNEWTPSCRSLRGMEAAVRGTARRAFRVRQREVAALDPEEVARFRQSRRTMLDAIIDPPFTLPRAMTEDEVVDEILITFGAALETKASVMAFALKALSLRPDVQDKVHEELRRVLGDDRTVYAEDLAKLNYLECVIKETMRLYPAVPMVMRHVPADTELCGYKLPKDSNLIINIFGLHRHPEVWPEPLRFDPDRFLPENSEGRHRCAFIPFSAGPRNCVGSGYAMMVMLTVLAVLLRKYRVDPVDDGCTDPGQIPVEFGMVLKQVGGKRVRFSPRIANNPTPRACDKLS